MAARVGSDGLRSIIVGSTLLLSASATSTIVTPPPAYGVEGAAAVSGTIRVYVHQHPERVAAMDDLVVVGTDSNGAPVFRTEAELADSPPTLGCALYSREQRHWFAVRTTDLLPPDRVFAAPSYTDRDGGVCEFRDVPRGEHAGIFVVERNDRDRDLFMTFSVPKFDVIPDALVPLLPVSLLRWMAGIPWMADTLALLQVAPTEDWAATRPLGAKLETPVDVDVVPPRPRYDGARFKFNPRRGDLIMHVTLRRLEVTSAVVDLGPGTATRYVPREGPRP